MQREAQLTFFEYMVLSVLSEQPARTMQMSALAARAAASQSRLSHVVGRLEKRELLARNRIPGSGRRTTATLTEAGYEVVVAAAPGHVAAVREYLIDDLEPQELAALRRIGAAVDAAIKRKQPDAGSAASPRPKHRRSTADRGIPRTDGGAAPRGPPARPRRGPRRSRAWEGVIIRLVEHSCGEA